MLRSGFSEHLPPKDPEVRKQSLEHFGTKLGKPIEFLLFPLIIPDPSPPPGPFDGPFSTHCPAPLPPPNCSQRVSFGRSYELVGPVVVVVQLCTE